MASPTLNVSARVRHRPGAPAYSMHRWPAALLNVVENCMNIGYLYLAHVKGSPSAALLGFASAVMTLSKTALYWLQEYYCSGCSVGHNTLKDLIVLWVIPNGCASCPSCRHPAVGSPRSFSS